MKFPEFVRHTDYHMSGVVGRERNEETGEFRVEWSSGEEEWLPLSGEGSGWERMLDRSTVADCLKVVKEWAGEPNNAMMHDPGFHAEAWTISMEEGPYEWVYEAVEGVDWPDGVFVEPLNHWAMCLYVAD